MLGKLEHAALPNESVHNPKSHTNHQSQAAVGATLRVGRVSGNWPRSRRGRPQTLLPRHPGASELYGSLWLPTPTMDRSLINCSVPHSPRLLPIPTGSCKADQHRPYTMQTQGFLSPPPTPGKPAQNYPVQPVLKIARNLGKSCFELGARG